VRETSVARSERSAAPHQSGDRGHQLVGELRGLTLTVTFNDAVTRVVVKQTERDLVERRLNGGNLSQQYPLLVYVT
jgi:hypothetical protein